MDNQSVIPCRCCESAANTVLTGTIIGIDVQYFECSACGFVQTEEPGWLQLAYSDAINDSDTGLVQRNLLNARYVMATLRALGVPTGKVVDFAGGYGLLVRLLRDSGVNAWWSDPFCKNLMAKGYENANDNDNTPADLITAFEAFEHFVNPAQELDLMLESGRNIFLSTLVMPRPIPRHEDWWYYGREHGQHVAFYRLETFKAMAARHGLHFVSNGRNYHLFSDKPVNHKYWRLWLKMGKANVPWLYMGLKSLTQADHREHTKHSSLVK